LKDGSRVATLRFASPVLTAHLHPSDPFSIVAIAYGDEPYVITVGKEESSIYKSVTKKVITLSDETDPTTNTTKDSIMASLICFDPKGDHIYIGTTKGLLIICDLEGKVEIVEKVTAGSSLSSLHFSHSGRFALRMVVQGMNRLKWDSFRKTEI
jgi:COMPASS component SWD1